MGFSLGLSCVSPVAAQTPTGSISGHVAASDGTALSGVEITVQGPSSTRATTDQSGNFTVANLQPGLYRVTATKGAYVTATREDVTVVAGPATSVTIALTPSSFSSLKEIAHVTVPGAAGTSTINTSAASVATITPSTALDQGLTTLTEVLNQTPGIVTTNNNFGSSSAAYASSVQEPQIRGSLPYESLVEVDGHPLVVGSSGYYSLLYLTPYTMQDLELVKGPGAMPDVITGAIGGVLNYRTLEPTKDPYLGADLMYRNDWSWSSNFKATGTTANGKLGYAFDYGILGQNGPLQNYPAYTASLYSKINGGPICGAGAPGCPLGSGPPPPSYIYAPSALSLSFPVALCCDYLNSPFSDHTYLGKLRYDFSPSTSLTATFLGATAYQVQSNDYGIGGLYFEPPAGYTGSLPAGTQLPFAFLGRGGNIPTDRNQQGLFSTEFRTAVGQNTLLLRYYTGSQQDMTLEPLPNAAATFPYQVWGGLPIGPGGTYEYFNGQTELFGPSAAAGDYEFSDDRFAGYTGEFDVPWGNNLLTASIDRTVRSSVYDYFGTAVVPPGASQAILTGMLRGTFSLGPKLTAVLGNYFINYSSHYTPDGGATWANASDSLYLPRVSFTYLVNRNTSLRASAGSSFAPPYLALINTEGGAPIGNNSGFATYYTQTLNNGKISPETGFGQDIGIDQRLGAGDGATIVSADAYQTTLHGQFLPSTYVNGTYTATTGANAGRTEPLFVTTTTNLGVARYAGLELAIHRDPSVGFGYTAQGALIRGYAYDLPPGFYNTGAGPYTTNLGILPYANFYGGGDGYNGIGGASSVGNFGGSLPYAEGYAAVSYRFPGHSQLLFGGTYYGNNNSFNAPAFWTFNASARFQLTSKTSLQVSGVNINNRLSSPFTSLLGGEVLVPLANGLGGKTTLGNLGPAYYTIDVHQDIGR